MIGETNSRVRGVLAGSITNAAGYDGAAISSRNMQGYTPRAGDADSFILMDLPLLQRRAQDLVRNAPIVTGAINTRINNIVGTGLILQARIDRAMLSNLSDDDADALERKIEAEWAIWAKDCDIERTSNFNQLQEVAARSVFVSGEVFVIMPFLKRTGDVFGLKVQLVESERISNPNGQRNETLLIAGVEKDPSGAPSAYHIRTAHPGSTINTEKKWLRYPAFGAKTGRRNVLHLFRPMRPGQTRGVPELAPVIDLVKQLTRYTNAEVAAAVISAFFTVFVTTETGQGVAPIANAGNTGSTIGEDFELGHGNILNLMPGETIQTATPGRPNAAFGPFVEAIMQQIGVALEIPYEVLRGHFSASYSASRAALLEAQKAFKSRRQWLADGFCQPIYESWLTEAVALGRIQAPGFLDGDPSIRAAYVGAEWVGPSFGNIDPLKEAKAAEQRINIGVSTIAAESAMAGRDFESDHIQRAKEHRMRREAGLIETPVIAPVLNADTVQNMLEDALGERQ